jgi:hypothetical protein
MTRIAIILLFVTSILSGCQTTSSEYRQADYSPTAWAEWQKFCMIKEGMTHSQVYAILPSTGRFGAADGLEQESWKSEGNVEQDCAMMTLLYGEDGRVIRIDRGIEHGIHVSMPTLIETK